MRRFGRIFEQAERSPRQAGGAEPTVTNAARIRRLTLTNFRSYRAASITPAANLVVLTGPNGAGKTNVLEAISFLSPGRGLRRAQLDEVTFDEGDSEGGDQG